MSLNWIGLAAALATFISIWLGHVGVRKIEAASPALWVPASIAAALGLAMETGALLTHSLFISGTLGIVGMTLLFDALEFYRQHRRVAHGHAPANPRNPRHARLLAEHSSATTTNWLEREPAGHPVQPEELKAQMDQPR
jgi:Domain of unknown function (DUF4491)